MAQDLEIHVLADGNLLDIDIKDGWPLLVNVLNTPRQRAAIASYIARGSIPGQADVGAEWSAYMAGDRSLVEVDNQVKQNIQEMCGEGSIMNQFMPLYVPTEDGAIAIRLWDMGQQEQ